MKFFAFLALLLISFNAFCAAGTLNDDGSFKLSEESLKRLNVKFSKLTKAGPWLVPKESIVRIKFSRGIYRRYEGDITFVLIKIIKDLGEHVLIQSPDLELDDEIAIQGVSFLRVAETDLKSTTVDACAH